VPREWEPRHAPGDRVVDTRAGVVCALEKEPHLHAQAAVTANVGRCTKSSERHGTASCCETIRTIAMRIIATHERGGQPELLLALRRQEGLCVLLADPEQHAARTEHHFLVLLCARHRGTGLAETSAPLHDTPPNPQKRGRPVRVRKAWNTPWAAWAMSSLRDSRCGMTAYTVCGYL
jgi:hypothetical protein